MNWINAMETNLNNMETNLDEKDKIKHKEDIQNNQNHLNSLKGKDAIRVARICNQMYD